MFEPIDARSAAAAEERITPAYLRNVFAGYTDAGVLSKEVEEAVASNIKELIDLIRGPLTGEAFWAEFQKQFGFARSTPRITPMNAANLCPEPTVLLNAANSLRSAYNDNVAQQVRMAGGERVRQIQQVRTDLAKGLGIADANDLALIRNSSEGNNLISCGYRGWTVTNDPGKLDTVVVWGENHPTNLEAWRLRRDWPAGERRSDDKPRPGDPFELVVVRFDKDAKEQDIIEAFTSKIDKRTRFVSFSETSNGSGTRIPEAVIKAIWDKATSAGHQKCHVHIDGTMTWGARPVNLRTPWCHSFVSSAHKWFLGPKETAVLYMAKDKVKNFVPSIFAYDYKIEIDDWDKMPDTALRFELLGQRDDVNLITLHMTQMMWTALVARRNPYARVDELGGALRTALLQAGWKLKTPGDAGRNWGIVRVEAPRKAGSPSLYDWMYDEKRTHRFGGSGGSESDEQQTFRLCPHVYNTFVDVRNAVTAMNEWRSQHGKQ